MTGSAPPLPPAGEGGAERCASKSACARRPASARAGRRGVGTTVPHPMPWGGWLARRPVFVEVRTRTGVGGEGWG